jgi:GMP synthase-like glutamine amidotransferase
MLRKVYVQPPGAGLIYRMFDECNHWWSNSHPVLTKWQGCEDPDEADVIVWTGGSDIDPVIYGQHQIKETYTNPSRDEIEIKLYNRVVNKGKLLVGICRGGQLLNALNGGKMYQDVNGHGGTHPITCHLTDREVIVSSVHHQMMIPADDAMVIASCSPRGLPYPVRKYGVDLGNEYSHKWDHKTKEDYEVLYYESTNSFCFQPHPEFGPVTCTEYFFELIDYLYEDLAQKRQLTKEKV